MLRLSFALLIVGACAHPQKPSSSSMAPTPVEPATAPADPPKDLLEAKEPPEAPPAKKAEDPMPAATPPPPPPAPSKASKKSPPKNKPTPDRSADPCEGGQ